MTPEEYDARQKRTSDLAAQTQEQALESSRQADAMARLFTSQWLGEVATTKEMYAGAQGSIDDLKGFNTTLSNEYDAYMNKFGGTIDSLIAETGIDLKNRRTLANNFMALANPDLDGAGNRAMAGVAQQGSLAAEQIQRTMTRGGGNPSSSNYVGMVRQNALDTAKNKVLAGTVARNQEREVGLKAATTGMQLFDPNVTGGLSLKMQEGGTKILDRLGNNMATAASLEAGLAGSYAGNIAEPMGSAAGAWSGMAYTQNAAGSSSSSPTPTPSVSAVPKAGPSIFGMQESAPETAIQYGTRADGTFGML